MFQYVHPDAIEVEPVQPNTIGMHRVSFKVDNIDAALEIAARHGCHPLRGVATYEDVYKLTYLRGPSGILVMLAEELKRKTYHDRPWETRPLVRLELDDLGLQSRPGGTLGL
jgi:glyoxylase I family protein